MKKRQSSKQKKNNITKKSYFNVSNINLAHSSLNLSQTNLKNQILSLKLLENNIKNEKIKNKRRSSKNRYHFNSLSNVYKKNNFSRKNSIRKNNDKDLKLKNSVNNLYKNLNLKFELPKLKKKFCGKFTKSIDQYKNIFGEKENLKINLQQLKLLLSHLGLIGNVDNNWKCKNSNEKKFVNIIYEILRGEKKKIDFDFLRIILVLFNLLNKENLISFFSEKQIRNSNSDKNIVELEKNYQLNFRKINDINKIEKNIDFEIEKKVKNIDFEIENKIDLIKEDNQIKFKKNDFSFSGNFHLKENIEKHKNINFIENKDRFMEDLLFKNKIKNSENLESDKNSLFEDSDSESGDSLKIKSTLKKKRFENSLKKKKENSMHLDFLEGSKILTENLKQIKKLSSYKDSSDKNKINKKNSFQSYKLKKRNEKLFSAFINIKDTKKMIDVFKNDNIKMVVNKFSIENKLNKDQKKKLIFLLERKKENCLLKKNKEI